MKIDLNKALSKTIRSGEVLIGSNVSINAVKNGSNTTVVLAANCPAHVRAEIQGSDASIIEYPGMSIDLGIACGKPFTIAAMTILDPGDSGLLSVFEDEEPSETPETLEIPDEIEG